MKIHEHEIIKDDGNKALRVEFCSHKSCIYSFDVPLNFERCAALRTAQAKEKGIEEFLSSFEGQKFTKKEVLKAYSLVDDYFKGKYKELYPNGGWRGGGRKKGFRMKPEDKSPRTEYFLRRITPEEKKFMSVCLDIFRNQHENPLIVEILNKYKFEK